jgi:hypothetical protein
LPAELFFTCFQEGNRNKNKITNQKQKTMAKKKLPKKPRKPRASASIATKERFLERHREWEKKVKTIKSEHKKGEELTKKIKALK